MATSKTVLGVTKVDAFKTSDGKIHENQNAANEHELKLQLIAMFHSLQEFDLNNTYSFNAEDASNKSILLQLAQIGRFATQILDIKS